MGRSPVTVGIDIGQKVDPTAIVVADASHPTDPAVSSYTVRELGRLALGTPYPAVYAAVVAVVEALAARGILHPRLIVDATGAAPAVDGLRAALRGKQCTVVAATFTHGDRLVNDPHGFDTASVGKAYLVNRLQVLLGTDRLALPPSKPEAAVLARELQDYEIRVDEDANDKYGAFKVGTHDDLVTALGLAVLDYKSTRTYHKQYDAYATVNIWGREFPL